METAQFIAQATQKKIIVERRLCDMDTGEVAGLTHKEAYERYPEWHKDNRTRRPEEYSLDWSCPGGETYRSLLARVTEAWQEIKQQHVNDASSQIIIVTHDNVLEILCHFILDFPLDGGFRRFGPAKNCSLTRFEFVYGIPRINYFNEVGHIQHI